MNLHKYILPRFGIDMIVSLPEPEVWNIIIIHIINVNLEKEKMSFDIKNIHNLFTGLQN